MQIDRHSTGAPWETSVGYSRAIRAGRIIEVSGTVSIKDGAVFGAGNPYLQTKRILEIIRESIEALGGNMDQVIRTRTYVTDMAYWAEVGRAHGECFRDVRPATSLVAVKALIGPEYLVEIEATAFVSPD